MGHYCLQVPNNLGKLTNLRSLAIGHKLVKSMPEPVLQLTGLEELAITYCKLQKLPSNLAAMHRLHSLNLQGNTWLQVVALSALWDCIGIHDVRHTCCLKAL